MCECPRCLAPEPLETSAAACLNEKCDNFVNLSDSELDKKCAKCQTKVTEQFLMEFEEVVEFSDMHLQNMKQLACILLIFEFYCFLVYLLGLI